MDTFTDDMLLEELDVDFNISKETQKFITKMTSVSGYADVETAVLRENANNAYDGLLKRAYAEGVDVSTLPPVEVTLPDEGNDYTLTIQDFGSGMTMEETCYYHGGMWNSDKKNDTRFSGEMGIGAKSGHALSEVITVNTVKDGIRSIVIYQLKPDGTRTITPTFHGPTDDPNGTTISIPVSDKMSYGAWYLKAQTLFQWWEPGTILIDGQAVASNNISWLSDEVGVLFYEKHTTMPDHTIIMGRTPYPLPEKELKKFIDFDEFIKSEHMWTSGRVSLVFKIPNKSMTALTSREALVFNDEARTLIKEYAERAQELIIQHNQKMLDDLAQHNEERQSERFLSPYRFTSRTDHLAIGTLRGHRYTYNGENLAKINSTNFAQILTKHGGDASVIEVDTQHWYKYRIHPFGSGFQPHNNILLTHCGDEDISTITKMLRLWLKSEDGKSINYTRDTFHVYLKTDEPEGWETVFPFRLTLDVRDIMPTYREHVRHRQEKINDARREKAEIKKRERDAYAKKVNRKIKSTDYEVFRSVDLDSEKMFMDVDAIKAAKPKLLYVTNKNGNYPYRSQFWAEDKHRLVVTTSSPIKTCEKLRAAGLHPVNISSTVSWDEAQRITMNEWALTSRFIKNIISEDNIRHRDIQAYIERLIRVAENSDIEFKNARLRRFISEVSSKVIVPPTTSDYEWAKPFRNCDQSPFITWYAQHPLLDQIMKSETGWCNDIVFYINQKKVKL